ncbi:MAG: tRNA pseudouridine(38-40) synthase TruA, partial [Candidatus Omnitrophica bacterium]|nr:tRNA pseudouridine(38-40) synthase TruA [Candidatus Omnitrophota bacterium]
VKIDVTANGFLYKMVRNIVGTLLTCGQGKISTQDVARILTHRDRTLAPPAAPAHGLCLMKVAYRSGKKP